MSLSENSVSRLTCPPTLTHHKGSDHSETEELDVCKSAKN